jgi:hypothetical protein
MRIPRRLADAYRFPGFRPETLVRGLFGDPKARLVALRRRRKKRPVGHAVKRIEPFTTASFAASAICRAATLACSWNSKSDASIAAGAVP